MATTQVLQPRGLTTILNYHLEPARGGEEVWCPGTVRDKRRPHEHCEAVIKDVRGREAEYSLDVQGFQIDPFSSSINDLNNDKEFSGKYYQDVAAHIKKVTGATRVLPVVHICRRKQFEDLIKAEKDLPDGAPVTAPTSNRSVHVDQSYRGAEWVRDNKLESIDAAEAEKLKKCRWAIVNLWRPFDVVNRDNLALCDARTVKEEDLTSVTAEIPESLRNANSGYSFSAKSKSEAWEVKANPSHEWHYASHISPKEALLIKQFDSKKSGGVARRTPHCAVTSSADKGPTRQSIEVRCLVFWEDQLEE